MSLLDTGHNIFWDCCLRFFFFAKTFLEIAIYMLAYAGLLFGILRPVNIVYWTFSGALDQIRGAASREVVVPIFCWNLHHSGVGFNKCSVVPQTQRLTVKTLLDQSASHSY